MFGNVISTNWIVVSGWTGSSVIFGYLSFFKKQGFWLLLQHKNCKTCVEDSLAKEKIANFINLLSNSLTQSFGLLMNHLLTKVVWMSGILTFFVSAFLWISTRSIKKTRLFGQDVWGYFVFLWISSCSIKKQTEPNQTLGQYLQ